MSNNTPTLSSRDGSSRIKRRRDSDIAAAMSSSNKPTTTTTNNNNNTQKMSEESVKQYMFDLDSNITAFLSSINVKYEYYNKMVLTVRAANPFKKEGSTGATASSSTSTSPKAVPSKTALPVVPISPSTNTPYPFPDNTFLLQHLRCLKNAALELIHQFDCLQDWILIRIPTIKDEDNLGVEVQETCIAQLASYYKLVKSVYGEEGEYVNRRAEFETGYAKQPTTVSWLQSIEIHDQEEWDDLEMAWRTMTRAVMLTNSLLTKNMEKLKDPRPAYRSMHI
eukprot:PhM_4_TR9376/c0_g1_i1/m.69088